MAGRWRPLRPVV